jgi:putative membrane protein
MIYGQYQALGNKTLSYLLFSKITASLLILVLLIGSKIIVNNLSTKLLFIDQTIVSSIFWGLLLLWLIITVVSIVMIYLQYITYKIMITDDCLKISKGLFNKEEISLPFSRIESVDIKQSFDNQLFGVSRLIITPTNDLEEPMTTNTQTNRATDTEEEIIPVIDNILALALQDTLAQKANISKIRIQN